MWWSELPVAVGSCAAGRTTPRTWCKRCRHGSATKSGRKPPCDRPPAGHRLLHLHCHCPGPTSTQKRQSRDVGELGKRQCVLATGLVAATPRTPGRALDTRINLGRLLAIIQHQRAKGESGPALNQLGWPCNIPIHVVIAVCLLTPPPKQQNCSDKATGERVPHHGMACSNSICDPATNRDMVLDVFLNQVGSHATLSPSGGHMHMAL